MAKETAYDLAIIGAGPAGLSASVYASRYRLKNVVIGPELGGYVSTTHLVEDYLGYKSVTGLELSQHFVKHAEQFGADILAEKVTTVATTKAGFKLSTWGDRDLSARAILLATGTNHNKIGVPGEDKFEGRGVSYCVTCDAAFFKDKRVVIVGGGDSAMKGALHLSEFAKQVYLIHRRDSFRAEPIWVERVEALPNVSFILSNSLSEILGEQTVTGVTLRNPYEGKDELPIDGVFIEIGSSPDKTIADMVGATVDENNFLSVNHLQRTSVENVWGAGDNTTGSAMFRQIITAAAEGSIAAGDIYEYLNDDRNEWDQKGSLTGLVTD